MSPVPEEPTQPAFPRPGQGGWTPPAWVPAVVGACISGGLSGVGTALVSLQPGAPVDARNLFGAFIVGCGVGVAGYFGIKSAGVRKP